MNSPTKIELQFKMAHLTFLHFFDWKFDMSGFKRNKKN